jgi:hypothetical protein
MTLEELSEYLRNNQKIEWARDAEGNIYLRHSHYDRSNDKVKIEPGALEGLTPQKLERILVGGRNIEHITRVTGYFSRVSGWNKGKRGELADRKREVLSD